MASGDDALDLVTVGRVSVDLYPRESGVGFEAQQTFVKSVGGSPTNVAVGAARLGLRVAAVTAVGDDALGRYVGARLAAHGLDTRYVQVQPGERTPLALVALNPPEHPEVAFYRGLRPPDASLPAELFEQVSRRAVRAVWVSHAALAPGTTGDALAAWLVDRVDRDAGTTLLDLDHRPALWSDPHLARQRAAEAIACCQVVVGNQAECTMALGVDDPDRAADELLRRGVRLAVVKLGGDGVLMATPDERFRIASRPVEVVCGLGAGDAFGAALVYGLLAGLPLREIGRTACDAGAFVVGRLTCSDDMPTLQELRMMAATA